MQFRMAVLVAMGMATFACTTTLVQDATPDGGAAGPDAGRRSRRPDDDAGTAEDAPPPSTPAPTEADLVPLHRGALEEPGSAGKLTLEFASKTLVLTPGANGSYAPLSGSDALWAGGETLTVRADGADVPAFVTSLTAPPRLVVSAPAIAAGSLTVKRSAALDFTFEPAASGTAVLYFDVATDTKAFTATCSFPATAGQGQIPAGVFADFPRGFGTFDFYAKDAASATPNGWDVRFTASSAMVDGSGAALVGDAKFE